MEMRLQPFIILLCEALDLLQDKDPSRVFAEPVDVDEASFNLFHHHSNFEYIINGPGYEIETGTTLLCRTLEFIFLPFLISILTRFSYSLRGLSSGD